MVAVVCALVPFSVHALTLSDLQSQLIALQAQLAARQGSISTPPLSCPSLTRTLSRGMKGTDVTALQNYLISQKLLSTDSATGFFGAMTETAVKKFQCTHLTLCTGTPATTGYGVAGKMTRGKVASLCATRPTTPLVGTGTTTVTPTLPITPGGTVAPTILPSITPGGTPAPSGAPCSLNGVTVSHGQSVTAYQKATVPFGSLCASEVRVCTNGVLSGTYAEKTCESAPPPNDFISYLEVKAPTTYDVVHYNRNTDAQGNYLNTWSTSQSKQQNSVVQEQGRTVFMRTQVSALPPQGVYLEKFPFSREEGWMYLDYASLSGDVNPALSNAAACTVSDGSGCDFARPTGQKWAPNSMVQGGGGTDSSPALLTWDASPQSYHLYQGDVLRVTSNPNFAGQIWFRENWNAQKLLAYAVGVTNAATIGWNGLDISQLQTTLPIDDVFIVRQYSGCDATFTVATPWYSCEIFEDHIYAKDASGNPLGEVMVLVGFTPKHADWYKTVGDMWAVYHAMVAVQ